jgi:hypothetical protein
VDFTIFYSWQSDSPGDTNQHLIREGLRHAASRIEPEHAAHDLRVLLDEATRDVPGSPNIPQTIMDKIRAADLFVGDITTINKDRPMGARACPNPNVAIELGYAIAHLGWGRVILLFNRAHGVFPGDAPFDIDRHRLSDYEVEAIRGTNREKAAQKQPLFDLLHEALRLVVEARPQKPGSADELEPGERKRLRDVETLGGLLERIHIPTLDDFFEKIRQGMLPAIVLQFHAGFDEFVGSNLFHLYDEHLSTLVRKFRRAWSRCLGFSVYFGRRHPTDNFYVFDSLESEQQRQAWARLQRNVTAMEKTLGEILQVIRQRYVEIDITERSDSAWRVHVRIRDAVKAAFGDE